MHYPVFAHPPEANEPSHVNYQPRLFHTFSSAEFMSCESRSGFIYCGLLVIQLKGVLYYSRMTSSTLLSASHTSGTSLPKLPMADMRRLKFVCLLDNGQSHFGSFFLLGRGEHVAVLSSFTYLPTTQPSPVIPPTSTILPSSKLATSTHPAQT